ncbi:diguanylate cyclase [Seleniivibrio woodruffii]|uniref:GGDEF domain-containing response regulator n=1 Tax=Seleniivibrio woodruffii TaxID=1078050 RepID=UPI0026EA2C42|nr:diguanylate cyclase [Seleniivibrio woodruffii]
MDKILVVEDSNILGTLLKKRIELETGLEVDHAVTYAKAMEYTSAFDYFAAVVDLNLPDAAQAGMVDFAQDKKIPAIVYTGDYDENLREKIWKKNIVDYVLKKDPDSDIYIAKLLKQMMLNRNIDVIVADDSRLMRNRIKALLSAHLFRVHTCESGKEAFELAMKLENLKIVISDYLMPEISGFDLVRLIRKKFTKDKVAFIGMSREGTAELSAKFIKYGANDFLLKPFSPEQFYCRVNQNLQTLMLIDHIRDMSYKDYLTGLYNRRYFFMYMNEVFDIEKSKSIAVLDIDHFKRINDSFGHDVGDYVLKSISKAITEYVGRRGLVSRFGGEEFCIYVEPGADDEYFDGLRSMIENSGVSYNNIEINITVSIGVCSSYGKGLDNMISTADTLLYTAKNEGRNRVCSSS